MNGSCTFGIAPKTVGLQYLVKVCFVLILLLLTVIRIPDPVVVTGPGHSGDPAQCADTQQIVVPQCCFMN